MSTTTFDSQSAIQEFMEMCSCGRDKVVYVCTRKDCTEHDQLLYCKNCTGKSKKHDHGAVFISEESDDLKTKWQELKTNIETVLQKSEPFF